ARAKAGSERVHWIHGDAKSLPSLHVDLATMTGNVAQAIVEPSDWEATLRGVYKAMRPGGHLVFETRVPARRAWQEWNRAASHRNTDIQGVGAVESWCSLRCARSENGNAVRACWRKREIRRSQTRECRRSSRGQCTASIK